MLTNVGITVVPACMCRPIIEFSQVVYIIDPGFHLVLAGYQPAWAMWYIALIQQAFVPCLLRLYARALGPAALGLERLYQAKHSSLWYKYNLYIAYHDYCTLLYHNAINYCNNNSDNFMFHHCVNDVLTLVPFKTTQ